MKTALLVIDVQKALFDRLPRPYEADAVISRINVLAEKARAASVPVFFVQHEKPGTPVERDSEGWKLPDNLAARGDDLRIGKTSPDAFLQTALHETLQSRQIKHLVICGYASEFCVDTSTRRALGLGYNVTLVADAHTTHDKSHASGEQIRRHHNATLPGLAIAFEAQIAAVPSQDISFS